METSRFDSLVRALGEGGATRRTLTGLIGGALLAALPLASEAKKRKKCKRKSLAKICAGTCGPVKNRKTCKKTVDCGSCACSPACGVCFTCKDGPNTPGTCIVDAAQQGEACGSNGKVCQPDGTCACIPLTQCPAGKDCGTVPDGCGGVVHCQFLCANPTPICTDNICKACTSSDQCVSGEMCESGSCVACDVCADGCTYSTPQAAINDGAGPTSIRICPGTYGGVYKDNNARNVTIIGAGDGEDPANNTILTDPGTGTTVSFIFGTSSMRKVRITGGGNSGLSNQFATLSLTDCTITKNNTPDYPGGISNSGPLTLTNVNVIENTAGALAGGILNSSEGTITFAGTNLVAFNKLTGGNTGSGIYNTGTILGFANVEVRDNEPAEFQCFGCPV